MSVTKGQYEKDKLEMKGDIAFLRRELDLSKEKAVAVDRERNQVFFD
jgi:hypothetical protein